MVVLASLLWATASLSGMDEPPHAADAASGPLSTVATASPAAQGTPPQTGQDGPPQTPTGQDGPPQTIATASDADQHMTLPVQINGKGPYRFFIDTGAQRSMMSAELARTLNLAAGQQVTVIGVAGAASMSTVSIPRLNYGRQEVRDLEVPVANSDDLGGAGLLGLDGLSGKRVVLDFKAKRLDVFNSVGRYRSVDADGAIVVQARSRLGQLILVDSRVDGRKVNVILDTGTHYSIGNMALFRKLKLDKLTSERLPITLQSVTGDKVTADLVVVKHMEVGGISLENVPVLFTDAAPFQHLDLLDRPAMLLGMQMLQLFDRVAIDFGRREINFLRPQGRRDADDRLASQGSLQPRS